MGVASVTQAPVIVVDEPNCVPLIRVPGPPAGKYRTHCWASSVNLSFRPGQAFASGADDAAWVRNSAPRTAAATNARPARSESPAASPTSPIRCRSHARCSSATWNRTRNRSAAMEYSTSSGYWSRIVSTTFARRIDPGRTTAATGRRSA
jgi:hypothetical protein